MSRTREVFKRIGWILVFVFVWMVLGIKWSRIKAIAKKHQMDNTIYSDELRYRKVFSFLKTYLYVKQITIIKSGKEKLDSKKLFLVSNHKSNLDAMVILKTVLGQKTPLPRFVAKIELASSKYAPIFNLLDVIYIDRENLREVVKTINKETEILTENKYSIAVFPEGTRITTDEFGEFKSAAFTPAFKTLTTIQPMVIYNSTHLLEQSSIKLNRIVYINFMNPILPTKFATINMDIFVKNLQADMYKEYLQLKTDIENKKNGKSKK